MPTTTALTIDRGNSRGSEFSMILASVLLIAQYSAVSIIASACSCVRLDTGGQPVLKIPGSLACEKWDAGVGNWAAWDSRTIVRGENLERPRACKFKLNFVAKGKLHQAYNVPLTVYRVSVPGRNCFCDRATRGTCSLPRGIEPTGRRGCGTTHEP